MGGRKPLLIGVSVLLVIALIGAFVWWQNKERACDRWREDFRSAAEAAEDFARQTGISGIQLTEAQLRPFARRVFEVAEDRPSGCPAPDTAFTHLLD